MEYGRNRIVGLLLAIIITVTMIPFIGRTEAHAADKYGNLKQVNTTENEDIDINETYFPDKGFRSYVKLSIDVDNDGKLSTDEIKAVTSISIAEKPSLTNVDGIELFTGLKFFSSSGNKNIKRIDLSQNKELIEFEFAESKASEINLSGCTKLKKFESDTSKINSIDVSGCKSLESIHLGFPHNLKKLNISKCNNLKYVRATCNHIKKLDLSACTKLLRLEVSGNDISKIDVSKCKKLKDLSVDDNKLKKLDVSKCRKLEFLCAGNNKLKTLNLSKCKNLKNVYIENNRLNRLNVSKCSKLETLYADSNRLKKLSLAKCNSLKNLDVAKNKLRKLKTSNCKKLKFLSCYKNKIKRLNITKNKKLQHVEVDKKTKVIKRGKWFESSYRKTITLQKKTDLIDR